MKYDSDQIEKMVRLVRGELDPEEANTVNKAIKSIPEAAELYSMISDLELVRRSGRISGDSRVVAELSRQLYRDFQKACPV